MAEDYSKKALRAAADDAAAGIVPAGSISAAELDPTNLAFFGATATTQPTAVADAAAGATVDAEARTALNDLLARLRTLGIIAT